MSLTWAGGIIIQITQATIAFTMRETMPAVAAPPQGLLVRVGVVVVYR